LPTIDPTRQDTWRVHLWVDDVRTDTDSRVDFGVWDKKSGGSIDSEERIYHPGGMVPPISLGGRTTPEAVTMSKIYDLNKDPDRLDCLLAGVGRASCLVAQQAMSIRASDAGPVLTYEGTLKTVTPPDHDSEGNDPAMIEVVVSIPSAPVLSQPSPTISPTG
jgi:hypothetical protein